MSISYHILAKLISNLKDNIKYSYPLKSRKLSFYFKICAICVKTNDMLKKSIIFNILCEYVKKIANFQHILTKASE